MNGKIWTVFACLFLGGGIAGFLVIALAMCSPKPSTVDSETTTQVSKAVEETDDRPSQPEPAVEEEKYSKKVSDKPTPYPDVYGHDAFSVKDNIYDESKVISYADAYQYVGQDMTVEGDAVSVAYASSSSGSPYFINIGADYGEPGGFTVVIWEENQRQFDNQYLELLLEWSMSDEPMAVHMRVSGTIEDYEGRPEIVARDGSQIAVSVDDGDWMTIMSDDVMFSLMENGDAIRDNRSDDVWDDSWYEQWD